jgi:hypothetical protein
MSPVSNATIQFRKTRLDAALVERVLEYWRAQFPRPCTSCARPFADLNDFLAVTTRNGPGQWSDPEAPSFEFEEPLHLLVYFTCPCGSTLTIGGGAPLQELYRAVSRRRREPDEASGSREELLEVLSSISQGTWSGAARGCDSEH